MAINSEQLRTLIIRPTLEYLGLWSQSAENLLLGTAAQESHMGTYIAQIKGPALGIYQMEPATHNDIYNNYLGHRHDIGAKIADLMDQSWIDLEPWDKMAGNLYYATAMARVHYLRVSEKLPEATDIEGLARYWKKYYNTELGKGTEGEFTDNYRKYVK